MSFMERHNLVSKPIRYTVLGVMSDPVGMNPLKLQSEWARIKQAYAEGVAALPPERRRVEFDFQLVTAAAIPALVAAVMANQPRFIHVMGHGLDDASVKSWLQGKATAAKATAATAKKADKPKAEWEATDAQAAVKFAKGGLVLEDHSGNMQIVAPESFADLIEPVGTVECVFMNACYSIAFAKPLLAFAKFVVGMKEPVSDPAAVAMAPMFYMGLVQGMTYLQAFKVALAAARSAKPTNWDIPTYDVASGFDAAKERLYDPKAPMPVSAELQAELGMDERCTRSGEPGDDTSSRSGHGGGSRGL